MSIERSELPGWTRRRFVGAGLATAGAALLGACAPAPGVSTRGPSAGGLGADLDQLAGKIHGRLLRPGSPLYDDARVVWNKAYDRHPLALARCADLDDVRRCVALARRHELAVAIRGGGHSYAGLGVADDALQIDLAAFNAVKVDAERRIASVGGGTRIRELLTATLAAGLTTPMGACGDVGVAGLALAGGDTAGRGLYGTACDNVIGAQLVTADGEVLELGPDLNQDLYWAIRGGGGNFGVVTRLDFRLYPVRPFHSAYFEFGWTDIAGAMRSFAELIREPADEVRVGFFTDPDGGASASCGSYADLPVAKAFIDQCRAAFRSPHTPMKTTAAPDPQGEVWHSTAVAVNGAFLEGLSDDLIDVLARAAIDGRGVGAILMGLSSGKAARIGMTDTAYALRGTGLSSLLSATWTTPEQRVRAEQWIAEHGAALRPWAQRAYVNYMAPSSPERVREVYGVNYPRLARIKARYDPANLFRVNQNILPSVEA